MHETCLKTFANVHGPQPCPGMVQNATWVVSSSTLQHNAHPWYLKSPSLKSVNSGDNHKNVFSVIRNGVTSTPLATYPRDVSLYGNDMWASNLNV